MVLQTIIANIYFQPGDLLTWLIVGLVAGFLAGTFIRGRGFGCIGNIIVGLVGAFIGGFLADLLNIQGTYGIVGTIVIAFIGSSILVAILYFITGGDES